MYDRPPLVAQASIQHANGTVTVTVVPAPGAGFRLRLVGGQLGTSRTTTAAADLNLLNGAGGNTIAQASGLLTTGTSTVALVIPEPGIQLDDNALLQLQASNSNTAGFARALVYYYIDQAT